MWNLIGITARNICTFTKLEYQPTQNVATLIFGNNEDDGENQKHNGSGKSAFLECVGFGITGEPFRKVDTVEDIIRDDEDYAEVDLELFNQETKDRMLIHRRIERGQSQKVTVDTTTGNETTSIPFVSVLETNRQILELLGISKDDLYHNYLLNDNRFKSFFSCSDKDKKEIINTFSNGIIVDEAIEALKADMADIQEDVDQANLECSRVDGAIEAIQSQIDEEENNQESAEAGRKEKINGLNEKIARQREFIRSLKSEIKVLADRACDYDGLAEKIEKLADVELDLATLNSKILEILSKTTHDLVSKTSDWGGKIAELNERKERDGRRIVDLNEELKGIQVKMEQAKYQLEQAAAEYEKKKADNHAKDEADNKEIGEILEDIKKYEAIVKKDFDDAVEKNQEAANLQHDLLMVKAAIKGAVECPKCGHRFSVGENLSFDELQAKEKELEENIDQLHSEADKFGEHRKKNETEIENCRLDIKDIQADIHDREIALGELFEKGKSHRFAYNSNVEAFNKLGERITSLKASITSIENEISRLSESMINEAVDLLDDAIDAMDREKKGKHNQIKEAESAIEVYTASIKELENTSVTGVVDKLKASLVAKQEEKEKVDKAQREVVARLNELKEQEARFVSFKTHLANTKINSIAQITNKVLQDVKSPLRVHLSGFTVTKSGKMRDKISVSVTRDGVDCGSFLKCSAGERARIMFANIVAMQRMTNLTANGGGLNLICLDEVMDHCEEAGIMSVADIANQLGVTVLLITQGKTTESYPHELVVTKRCGISFVSSKASVSK